LRMGLFMVADPWQDGVISMDAPEARGGVG
jgi:hypothetical protein